MDTANTERILSRVPLETTIKVNRELRERINAAAREQRMTPARFLGVLVGEYERQRWVALAVAEMNAAPDDDDEEPPYPMPEGLIPFVAEPDGVPDPDPYPKPRWIAELERREAERGERP
ncbi:MAG: hypothetical protein ACKO2Y_11915 [Actinomycetota bacterium]